MTEFHIYRTSGGNDPPCSAAFAGKRDHNGQPVWMARIDSIAGLLALIDETECPLVIGKALEPLTGRPSIEIYDFARKS